MIDYNDAREQCGCNQGGEDDYMCMHKPDPFSNEELSILEHMRLIKDEVRHLKYRLQEIEIESNGQDLPPQLLEEKLFCSDRLEALRLVFKRLKQESEEAALRRMIALGHIDPE
ncbi:MAG: hypothetical protein ACYTG7_17255 [Planctomycetota bacterium]|jgi:hypothetical protein